MKSFKAVEKEDFMFLGQYNLQEVMKKFNDELKVLNGVKFENINVFHKMIKEKIEEVIASLGLSNYLNCGSCWNIRFKDDYKLEMFSYSKTTTEDDKRVKFGRKGKIIDIVLSLSFYEVENKEQVEKIYNELLGCENSTLADLLFEIININLNKYMDNCRNNMRIAEEELQQAKSSLQQLIDEKNDFNDMISKKTN